MAKDKLDPKWESFVDRCVRSTLLEMGGQLRSLKLKEDELELGKVAIARALIVAGGSIIHEHTGMHMEATEEMIQDIVKSFCSEG